MCLLEDDFKQGEWHVLLRMLFLSIDTLFDTLLTVLNLPVRIHYHIWERYIRSEIELDVDVLQ